MPPTLPNTLTNGTTADASQVMADLNAINAAVDQATVTSLPGSPYDGQEIYYLADATNGVVWHLKYRSGSGSSYKWECVGGPPLVATTGSNTGFSGGRETYSSTTFGDLATAGPSITLPLAGDYDIDGLASVEATGNTSAQIRPWQTGEATNFVWNNAADIWYFYAQLAGIGSWSGYTRRTGEAASNVVKLQYSVSNNGTSLSFWNRRLRARPVRVG